MFDKVHGDGIPGLKRDRKRLEQTVRTVKTRFVPTASGTGLDVISNEFADLWPGVLASNEIESSILSEMSSEWVIVMIAEALKSEIVARGNVDPVVQA